MLSSSQITPPSYFGRGQRAGDVDGHDQPVTGPRRMPPADLGDGIMKEARA
jgi:hypothetical protein